MKKETEPVVLEESLDSDASDRNGADLSTWMFDLGAILLLAASLAVGLASWKTVFSSPDRILCSSGVLAGLLIAIFRSKWSGDRTWSNVRMARLACVLGSALICFSAFDSNPLWSAIAVGVIFGGWCMGRIRGDSVFHGMFLGAVLLTPFAIDGIAWMGGFQYLESFAVVMTSLIADIAGEPHAREETSILFGKGTATYFASVGVWDSVVGLYGVLLFCILAFRRRLLAAVVNLFLCSIVWATVRSIAWVVIANMSKDETSFTWSFELELVLFIISAGLVFSLDQFFATVFEPIPFEYFNSETPLGSFVWNWLCGLPRLSLRIPRRNKISQRWRTLLHIAGKKPSLKTDFEWIRIEFFDLILHPINAIGSMIDVVRGWKDSRKWFRFFCHFPSILFLIGTYLTLAFYSTRPADNRVEFLLDESQKLCSTEQLEATTKRQQEPGFCKAINAMESTEETPAPIPESVRRQVEIQSRRVLDAFPDNGVAKYRLGLIYAISDDTDRAIKTMTELAIAKPVDFPQADAWLAKTYIIRNSTGLEVPVQKVLAHLENAHGKKWKNEKNKDIRLLMFHAGLLEKRREYNRAIFVAKQAVSADPDLILELARLYGRIGNDEKKLETAQEAAGHFFARTNSESEKESDIMAVADAMLLGDKPDEAVKVLREGLGRNPNSDFLRRMLCKIQLAYYAKSVKKNEDGTIELDISLLETAAETDPTDPTISSEIAKLLPFGYGKKITPKLLNILKSQIDLGIVSVPSLRLLGEGFYAQGKLEAAKKYWELALAKEPNDFVVLNNLATCLIGLSPADTDRALEMIVRANSILPNNGDMLDTWGEVLLVANRPKEAINKFELAIKVNPNRIDSRRKLIRAYEMSGMVDDAKFQARELERVLQNEQKKANP